MKYIENQIFENKKITKLDNIQFVECIFKNCSLDKCQCKNTQFLECVFEKSKLIQVEFIHSQMRNCSFKNCDCIGLSFGNIVPPDRVNILFQDCENTYFKYCIFQGMNLVKFQGISNTFEQCSFHHCDLRQANFKNCHLLNSDFQQSNLQRADFREAYGYLIDPKSNQLRGASFSIPEVLHLLDVFGIKID